MGAAVLAVLEMLLEVTDKCWQGVPEMFGYEPEFAEEPLVVVAVDGGDDVADARSKGDNAVCAEPHNDAGSCLQP